MKTYFADGMFEYSMVMIIQKKDGCPLQFCQHNNQTAPFMEIEPMIQNIDESMRFRFLSSIFILCHSILIFFSLHFGLRTRDFRAVVRELIETEEEFVRDLNHVVDKYIKIVENSKLKPPKIIIDNKEVIFGNFKQIAEFHNT